jgi:uridine kinase
MRTIVTVDGIDGSGKSTFARRLLDALGGRAALVSIDSFRRPVDWAAANEADVYYNGYFDLAACEAALQAFLGGAASVAIPIFDSVTERITGTRTLALEGTAVVIVEGVFPLRLPSTAGGLVMYLETDAVEARRRIIQRDLEKGRTRDEIERRIDRRYAPAQARYHAAHTPRARADIVIDNQQPTAPRVSARSLARLPPELQALFDRVLPR